MGTPEEVLRFWLDDCDPRDWYKSEAEFDAQIREQFEDTWKNAMDGRYALWLTYPSGALAYIILMDQLPRNMFRDSAKSFSSDRYALAAAKQAIHRGWDMRIDAPARQFFYLPLMHSENLCDQDRCVRLIKERMPQDSDNLVHAKVHREVIRRFGRFPYRNPALSRKTRSDEQAFMDDGGYGAILRGYQSQEAA